MMGAEAIERATGILSINMFGITEGLVLTWHTSVAGAGATQQRGHALLSPTMRVRLLRPGAVEEVSIGDAGELCFRGPSTLRSYYAAPEINAVSFTPDGFFRTGDVMRAAVIEEQIVYRFEGRMKDNHQPWWRKIWNGGNRASDCTPSSNRRRQGGGDARSHLRGEGMRVPDRSRRPDAA
ncbi:hypothetical protein ACTMU2_17335 [Cupriavidus basilensis]